MSLISPQDEVPPDQITHLIRSTPMRRVQIVAVAICVILNLLDGFDLLAMAFAAPAVAAEWAIQPGQLGILFSAALLGVGVGALFMSPVADMIGRRPTILICLGVVGSGMLLSAWTEGLTELAAARLYTGIGIGAMLGSLSAIAVENASARRLGLIVGLMAAGFPLGATVGGICASWLVDIHGWRSVFVVGGGATLAMIPLSFFLLPESVSYLAFRSTPRSLARAKRLLARMQLPSIAPSSSAGGGAPAVGARFRALFGSEVRRVALVLATIFLLVLTSFYSMINWVPKLIVQAGFTGQQGVVAGTVINASGVVGGLAAGLLVYRFGLRRVAIAVVALMAVTIVAFGLVMDRGGPLLPVAASMGFMLYAALMGLYGLMTTSFPVAVRVTAMGLVTTAGRLGSIVGPIAVGGGLANGISTSLLCVLLALPPCLAAIILARFPLSAQD